MSTSRILPVSALEASDYNPNHITDERFTELVNEVKTGERPTHELALDDLARKIDVHHHGVQIALSHGLDHILKAKRRQL